MHVKIWFKTWLGLMMTSKGFRCIYVTSCYPSSRLWHFMNCDIFPKPRGEVCIVSNLVNVTNHGPGYMRWQHIALYHLLCSILNPYIFTITCLSENALKINSVFCKNKRMIHSNTFTGLCSTVKYPLWNIGMEFNFDHNIMSCKMLGVGLSRVRKMSEDEARMVAQ